MSCMVFGACETKYSMSIPFGNCDMPPLEENAKTKCKSQSLLYYASCMDRLSYIEKTHTTNTQFRILVSVFFVSVFHSFGGFFFLFISIKYFQFKRRLSSDIFYVNLCWIYTLCTNACIFFPLAVCFYQCLTLKEIWGVFWGI